MSIISGKSPRWHVWVLFIGGCIMSAFKAATNTEVVGTTAIVLLIVIVACWAIVTIRRLNDLARSRWWAVGLLIPVFNLALLLGLLFRRSSAEIGKHFAQLEPESSASKDTKKKDIALDSKKCPKCAEDVKFEAQVCRYCGHVFDEAEILETKQKAAKERPHPEAYFGEIKKGDISVGLKTCPSCAEEIKLEALVCRFCGHKFEKTQVENNKKSLEHKASLKNKQTKQNEMTRSWKLRHTSGIFLIFLGIIFFLLISIPNVLTANRTATPIFAILIALLFSIPFFLPSAILLRDAKKIKGNLVKLKEEINVLEDWTRLREEINVLHSKNGRT